MLLLLLPFLLSNLGPNRVFSSLKIGLKAEFGKMSAVAKTNFGKKSAVAGNVNKPTLYCRYSKIEIKGKMIHWTEPWKRTRSTQAYKHAIRQLHLPFQKEFASPSPCFSTNLS